MRKTILGRLAGLAGAIAIVPVVASAQLGGGIVFTPYVGVYAPANNLVKAAAGSSALSARVSAKHQSAALFGANASYWMTDRFALEVGGAYTKSGLHTTGAINEGSITTAAAGTDDAHVLLGSAKLMMQLLPSTSDFNLRLGFGPAVISRGGTAYKADADGRVTGLTDLGAAISLCTRFDVASKVGIRLRAEDYIYQSRLGWRATDPTQSYTFNEKMQHDFAVSAGLQLFLNR
jgi:hypothetical protein